MVGAAPQLTYQLFLERLAMRGEELLCVYVGVRVRVYLLSISFCRKRRAGRGSSVESLSLRFCLASSYCHIIMMMMMVVVVVMTTSVMSLAGASVIATPFKTSFDHFLIVDECRMKFDQGLIAMQKNAATLLPSRDASDSPPLPSDLPIFGVGHSLGSLIHLLLCARYGPDRCGNALLSFNNRPVKEAVPVFR